MADRFIATLYVLCPTEEDLGMLKSYVVTNVCICGQEGGKRQAVGARQEGKRAVDSDHEASKGGSSRLPTESHNSK